MDETDALRAKRCNEDAVSLAPSTAEAIIVEDAHYAAVRADLESDAQDLEAESWSSAVDQLYVKKLSREAVKRQDVIYELMQTEMHHVRTLKIMLRVYVRELKENLQMDAGRLDCLFPPWKISWSFTLTSCLVSKSGSEKTSFRPATGTTPSTKWQTF